MSVVTNKHRLLETYRMSHKNRTLSIIRKVGILRPRDLEAQGIPREYLRRLLEEGSIKRIGRGLYSLVDAEITESHDLAEAAKAIPQGVLCLITALQYHGLTTQIAHQVWIAIDPKARLPKKTNAPVKIVRFSGVALTSGIEEKRIENVPVRIYCPAKTVADCFKYRNKVGLDVALEALRDCWRQRLSSMDELWRYAKICRVSNVMRPYLESLI